MQTLDQNTVVKDVISIESPESRARDQAVAELGTPDGHNALISMKNSGFDWQKVLPPGFSSPDIGNDGSISFLSAPDQTYHAPVDTGSGKWRDNLGLGLGAGLSSLGGTFGAMLGNGIEEAIRGKRCGTVGALIGLGIGVTPGVVLEVKSLWHR